MASDEEVSVILKSFYQVYNTLGYGFLEKVYQNALYFELMERGLKCETGKKIDVFYKGKRVGEYYADIMVNDSIILELKATDIEVGYLLNFGKSPEFKRKIFSKPRQSI